MKYGLGLFIGLFVVMSVVGMAQNTPWKFAISGDSRNCGDVVMPAIAQGVQKSGAEFYWHLGDFRAIYTLDEDLVPPSQLGLPPKPMTISTYQSTAWQDFIVHQLGPFGNLPLFLSPGNHEFIPPASRDAYLAQFADWLNAPRLREQRLKDDPQDHKLRSYYHWVRGNVDFIALDNASGEQFDPLQMNWIRSAIDRDEKSNQIQTIIVGMHAALPGSLGDSHSMSESGTGERTGRQIYEALLHAQNSAHKRVYVFASHSHFFMEDIFRTDTWKGKVLPGWIVGTAGAVRYRLPPGVAAGPKAKTDVYGFLVATVAQDGSISTEFKQLALDDLRRANPSTPGPLVQWCFDNNKQ
jgi:Calcineurin-like phosphoesterase